MVVPGILAVLLVIAAIYGDVRHGKIPNALVAFGFLSGFVVNFSLIGPRGLLLSAEGGSLGIALLLLPFALGGMGAGDVKLLGAIGTLIGPRGVFFTALYGALAGGVMAAFVLMRHRRFLATLRSLGFSFLLFLLGAPVGRSQDFGQSKGGNGSISFPYSLAIGAGLFLALILPGTG